MNGRLISGLLLVMLLAACGEKKHNLSTQEQTNAKLGGMEFATAAGGKFVSCSGMDSNNDDYTTCTITDAKGDMLEIVCAYRGEAKGCKKK